MPRTFRLDAFVAAVDRTLSGVLAREPRRPARRRLVAARNDVAASAALGREVPPGLSEDHLVSVADYPDVHVRVYRPAHALPGDAPRPILLAFCGGAFTLAGIDWPSWDALYRQRALDADIIIVAVDYAHAPEVTFPAQPEQGWAALEWTMARAASLGGDPTRLAVGGASSGGNIAAATLLMNLDRQGHPVRFQLLEAPALDLTMRFVKTQGITPRVPAFLLRRMGARLVRAYVPRRRDRASRYASPLLVRDLSRLPPAIVYTAELDPISAQGEEWVRRLSESGVPAVGMQLIGQPHTSSGLTGWVPAADHVHRDIVATLRTLHDAPVDYPSPLRNKPRRRH